LLLKGVWIQLRQGIRPPTPCYEWHAGTVGVVVCVDVCVDVCVRVRAVDPRDTQTRFLILRNKLLPPSIHPWLHPPLRSIGLSPRMSLQTVPKRCASTSVLVLGVRSGQIVPGK
jgi:hypothetical protein